MSGGNNRDMESDSKIMKNILYILLFIPAFLNGQIQFVISGDSLKLKGKKTFLWYNSNILADRNWVRSEISDSAIDTTYFLHGADTVNLSHRIDTITSCSGTVNHASNGLTISNDTVMMGGVLNTPTTIESDSAVASNPFWKYSKTGTQYSISHNLIRSSNRLSIIESVTPSAVYYYSTIGAQNYSKYAKLQSRYEKLTATGVIQPVNEFIIYDGVRVSILFQNGYGLGIGTTGDTTCTSRLHLGAQTTTAGTSSFKIDKGVPLSSPEVGAFYRDSTEFHMTDDTLKEQDFVQAAYGSMHGSMKTYTNSATFKTCTGLTAGSYLKYTSVNDSIIKASSGGNGFYKITYSGYTYTGTAQEAVSVIYKNNTMVIESACACYMGTINKDYPVFGSCIVYLNTNDVVKLKYETTVTDVSYGKINIIIERIDR